MLVNRRWDRSAILSCLEYFMREHHPNYYNTIRNPGTAANPDTDPDTNYIVIVQDLCLSGSLLWACWRFRFVVVVQKIRRSTRSRGVEVTFDNPKKHEVTYRWNQLAIQRIWWTWAVLDKNYNPFIAADSFCVITCDITGQISKQSFLQLFPIQIFCSYLCCVKLRSSGL